MVVVVWIMISPLGHGEKEVKIEWKCSGVIYLPVRVRLSAVLAQAGTQTGHTL